MLPETFYQWLTWLVSGFGIYLFREQQEHGRRIQKIEDINNLEIANLKNDIVDLEAKMDEGFKDLKQQIVTLSNNVYKSKKSC